MLSGHKSFIVLLLTEPDLLSGTHCIGICTLH